MRVPGHQEKSYTWRWTAPLTVLAVVAIALVMAVVVRPAEPVEAATFTVDNYGDVGGGACTHTANDCDLRSAIEQANLNAGVADTISFGSLSGTINLLAPLDPLNDTERTTIDSNGNILVDGGALPVCFEMDSADNVIRDLKITNCLIAIEITGAGATGNAVRGNTIYGNVAGVMIDSGATTNTVGTTSAADRNVIRDNGAGVWITGAGTSGNTVQGNYIGTDVTGNSAAANNYGVMDDSTSGNFILNNVISGNGADGIYLSGAVNGTVQGNLIGIGADASTPLGNVGAGVNIDNGATGNLVGGTAAQANTIAYNAGAGVVVDAGAADTTWPDAIRRNPIFLNPGGGILLTGAPNTGNFNATAPIIDGVNFSSGQHTISGHVDPAFYVAGSQVDVFKADSMGQGRQYLITATVNNTGVTATWGVSVCGLTAGDVVVATATDNLGDTSEFSLFPDPNSVVGSGTCAVAPVATTVPTATGTPPTSTPTTPVASYTPTRTSTPTTPVPTATATTGPMVSVTLAAGCNLETSTYPDGTAIATIAGAVSPSTTLNTIWKFIPGTGGWLGYDPHYPANPPSDLTVVNRLDAIFICVSSAATFTRPQI